MENIFNALIKAEQAELTSSDLVGKSYGLTLGVVVDVADPYKIGRVKALTANKGLKTTTDWLSRLTASSKISVPLVALGDTIVIGYFNGDPNQGVYLGVLNNMVAPVPEASSNLSMYPATPVVISSQSSITLNVGNSVLELKDGSLNITGVTSVKINGKQVATVGAKDNEGDTIISKGWS